MTLDKYIINNRYLHSSILINQAAFLNSIEQLSSKNIFESDLNMLFTSGNWKITLIILVQSISNISAMVN